jgi:hypothetical protein
MVRAMNRPVSDSGAARPADASGDCMLSALPVIRCQGRDTFSLRQLDECQRLPKGTTFRRFKACRAALVEGQDFFRLDAAEHAAWLSRLRAEGLIYASSVHVVLLTRLGIARLRAAPSLAT